MATNIVTAPGAFDIQAQEPLDMRIVKATPQEMYDIPLSKRYLGLTVYVQNENKTYQLRGGLGTYGTSANWEDMFPYASTDGLKAGLIKVGANLSIDLDGKLNASGGSGGVTDDDKGDITVSGGGSIWTINNNTITLANLSSEFTAAGKALLDDADAAAQRATLRLGSLALCSGTFIDDSYVSGNNTGDEDLDSINAILTGNVTAHWHDIYAPKASPTFTGTVILPNTTSIGTITSTELSHLDGVTSPIQTQFSGKISADISYNGNLNSITITGDYKIATGATNAPSGTTVNGSKLIHTNWDPNAARQVFYDYATNRIFTRRKITNIWQAWDELALLSTGGTFTGAVVLPIDTTITTSSGNIYPTQLNYLTNINNDVQGQLDNKTDGSGSLNTIAFWSGAKTLSFLSTVTYPTILELSYVKGTTSNIQNQLNSKAFGSGVTNTIAYWETPTTIDGLPTATYPSLTELALLKGVTGSPIQTQLNGKQATLTNPNTGTGTTNYVPKFTGTTTIGNSVIQETPSSNIGIGVSPSASAKLDVNGTAYVRGNLHVQSDVIAYSSTLSDRKLKENIKALEYGLQEINKLSSVRYDLIRNGQHHIGFIAQDVQAVMPELVTEYNHFDESILTLNYTEIIPVLVNAVKELNARLTELEQVAWH